MHPQTEVRAMPPLEKATKTEASPEHVVEERPALRTAVSKVGLPSRNTRD